MCFWFLLVMHVVLRICSFLMKFKLVYLEDRNLFNMIAFFS